MQLVHLYHAERNKRYSFRATFLVFWNVTPHSLVEVHWRSDVSVPSVVKVEEKVKEETWKKLLAAYLAGYCSTYYSKLKMDTLRHSETSEDFSRTTRHYIPEDGTLQSYSCENLKSNMTTCVFNYFFVLLIQNSGDWPC
jgi:hypothetical protein